MAIVKVLYRKNAARTIRYVFRGTAPGDQVDSEGCPPHEEGAIAEFRSIRDAHNYKEGNNQCVHIIQSWSPDDSARVSAADVNTMGRKLVEDYFKGHQFVIVTHTDTGKFHNHIVVNAMNMDTGRHIEPKRKHWHAMVKRNDQIAMERGLSVLGKEAALRRSHVPQKVQQMKRAGKQSWLLDIKSKADFARALSTNYSEYQGYLHALGSVQARVEDKNITYFYTGRSRGKRGDKLGKEYSKAGLEEAFRRNDERFALQPELRQVLQGRLSEFMLKPGSHLRNPGELLLDSGLAPGASGKDYSSFKKVSRGNHRALIPSDRELSNGIIPIDEIRRAKRSIPEYCRKHGIELTVNDRGHTVLKGREFVTIHEFEAVNGRNGTRGSLIDLVAAHHNTTLLGAVAKINENPRLKLFEQHFGEIKRTYTSFYVPKSDQRSWHESEKTLGSFLQSFGAKPGHSDTLLQKQLAQVSQSGVLRLFAQGEEHGALEFSQDASGKWNGVKKGQFHRPFFNRATRGEELWIFAHPQSFLQSKAARALSSSHLSQKGILVLMEPSTERVDEYLAQSSHVRTIRMFDSHGRSGPDLDFFGVLKGHLSRSKIDLEWIGPDHSLNRHGPELSR